MHVGGRAEQADLTERERENLRGDAGRPCAERGSPSSASTLIGDYLTEIQRDLGRPACARVKRFGGADIAALFWDAVETRRG